MVRAICPCIIFIHGDLLQHAAPPAFAFDWCVEALEEEAVIVERCIRTNLGTLWCHLGQTILLGGSTMVIGLVAPSPIVQDL